MRSNKPIIFVYAVSPSIEILNEVTAGMEEEGVLFEIVECKGKESLEAYALQAANASMLEAGIGMNGHNLCFNQSILKNSSPILRIENADKRSARIFGSNAARFIKGCSLKL